MKRTRGKTRGFRHGAVAADALMLRAGKARGFAVSRLLTHWPEIVGEEVAAISHPVGISHARHGLGGTLTLLTSGANAPVLDMTREEIRARANSVYGYCAISRIRITQTSAHALAKAVARETSAPTPHSVSADLLAAIAGIRDEGLRSALTGLGAGIAARQARKDGVTTAAWGKG